MAQPVTQLLLLPLLLLPPPSPQQQQQQQQQHTITPKPPPQQHIIVLIFHRDYDYIGTDYFSKMIALAPLPFISLGRIRYMFPVTRMKICV